MRPRRNRNVLAAALAAALASLMLSLPPALAVSDGQLGLPEYPHKHGYGHDGKWKRGKSGGYGGHHDVLHAGGGEKPYARSIADAVHKVRAGGTIVVYPGAESYEPIYIDKPLSIVAAPGAPVSLHPDGTRPCISIDVPPGERVEIVGLSFAPPPGGYRTAPCIVSRGADLRLIGTRVEASGLLPAVIVHGGSAWLEDNVITGGEKGLVLGGEPYGNHILIGNEIVGNTGEGLRAGTGARVIAAGNIISDNGAAGIADVGATGLYTHNDINGNGVGIALTGALKGVPGPTFSSNEVSANRGPGVDIAPGATGAVTSNCIHGNAGPAIFGYGAVTLSPPNYIYGNAGDPELSRHERRDAEELFQLACR